jgi:putative membrane protein
MRHEFIDGGGEGSTWQRGLFALLIVIAVAGAVVLLVRMWLAERPMHTLGRPGGGAPPHNPAVAELDLRYARGEVSREEYLQRRADLLGGHIGPPPGPGSAAPPGAPPAP